MKPHSGPKLWPAVLLLAAATVEAAYTAGGTAFTKRVETNLLAEPRPLASVTGKVGFAHQLKVNQVQGSWLQVSEGSNSGWVFSGNVATTKPEETKGLTDIPMDAAATTATAAARPLTPGAQDYAGRRGLGNARGDLDWLLKDGAKVTAADVDQYLKANKKGEYR